MDDEKIKQQWAVYEPGLSKHVEDLIWGLFSESKNPFFDKTKVSLHLVGEFAKDKDAQFLAFQFVSELKRIWGTRFPGSAKPSPKVRQANLKPKHMELHPLLGASAGLHSPNASGARDFIEIAPIFSPYNQRLKGSDMTNQHSKQDSHSSDPEAPKSTETTSSLVAPGPGLVSLLEESGAPSPPMLRPGQAPATSMRPSVLPESRPVFHLPNCKVGAPFTAKIDGVDRSGREVLVDDLRFPEGLGLTFDRSTQTVTGTPLEDGEFELDLQWSFRDVAGKSSGTCKLTSNPDPRSLWKVIEPAAGLPYPKAHLAQQMLVGANFRIAGASRRGRSHEHGGSFRDDDFFIFDNPDNGWSVIIVADGAGSAPNSREGSRLAVEAAGKYLVDSLSGEFGSRISAHLAVWDSDPSSQKSIGTEFHYCFHKMATTAVQAIEQEAQSQNAAAKSYSTTLLVAAIKKDETNTFLATFWMGDGAIAAYGPNGTVKLMGTPDGGEYAGQTRFLDRGAVSDVGFGKRVRVGRLQNVSAVMLMTDGVSDPYFETDNELADPAKWDCLWREIQPLLNSPAPETSILNWLHFFKQGHHDDRTIALMW